MKKYNVLWAVVELIDATDPDEAVQTLVNKLVIAGFEPYDLGDILPETYKFAFESEPIVKDGNGEDEKPVP